MNTSNRSLVWDLPVRLFHWLLAIVFAATVFILMVLGDESRYFPYHALFGLLATALIVFRIIWGIVGTSHTKFKALLLKPSEVFAYFRSVISGKKITYPGHNPATSWALIAICIWMLGLATTGILMGMGYESAKEVHEFFSGAMLATTALHIAGIVLHLFRHKENIITPMFTGRKATSANYAIHSQRIIPAGVFFVVFIIWAVGLFQNYNQQTGKLILPVTGTQLQLLENEHENEQEERPGLQMDAHD